MNQKKLIVFYGGTFDPVHYGHINSALALFYSMNIERLVFLPNNIPTHKPKPTTTSSQRIKMIRLSLNKKLNDIFYIDTRETLQNKLSRTINTFKDLRYVYGYKMSIGFLMGQDSLLTIHNWYHWLELFNLCHILVCNRPGYNNCNTVIYKNFLYDKFIKNPMLLYTKPAGFIYFIQSIFTSYISASVIRKMYRKGLSCIGLLPNAVNDYINKNNLYR